MSDLLIKIFYHDNFKSCPISRQISNCNFRIIGYCYLIDCCSNIIYNFDIQFKTSFVDILVSFLPNLNKIETLKVSKHYEFRILRF